MMRRWWVWIVAALAVTACGAKHTGPADVDGARIINSDSEPGEWMTIGRNYWEQRFSPLSAVNDGNVQGLHLAWFTNLDTEGGQEATPVVVDGVLYVTTAWSVVKAFEADTGRQIWEFDPKIDRRVGAIACCDVANRGVALWQGKVYFGALDGRLIALDAKTGAQVWSVQTTDPELPYTITGAPRIIHGKVIIGQGGSEFRARGYVSAYDAQTGVLNWRWYVVPGDPSKPYEQPELADAARTWHGDAYWRIGGGGTPWDGFAYDPELNLLYVGTGNGNPWNREIRSPGGGDNLFLSSIVALDADTGQYRWHYQTTPGESWDYTATQPIMLAELNFPEGKRKVVMQAPKNGFFYVLDAASGELISAEKIGPITWASSVDMQTGRPIENPDARYDLTGRPVILTPSAQGLHNWHPMAFSPDTGLVYIPIQVASAVFAPRRQFTLNLQGTNTGTDFTGGQTLCRHSATPCGNVESYILAWDPVHQREAWRIPNEVFGSSGILATAGNLIFAGNHNGEFAAYNATTGARLWTAPTQARSLAAPAAFSDHGKQYVALMVGGRGLPDNSIRTNPDSGNNSRLLVFSFGGEAALPDKMPEGVAGRSRLRIDPPLSTASNETVFEGEQAFTTNCAQCHGLNAVPGAGSIAPDLRYSALLPVRNSWNAVVRSGERAARGMPGWGDTLSPQTTDAILAYVIRRANDEKAAQEAAAPSAHQ